MFGTRQDSAPLRGRSILALSVLVLLAWGCLPVLAQAQSSAGLEYEDAPPTVPGHTATNGGGPAAHSANTGKGGSGNDNPNSAGNGSANDGSSKKSDATGAAGSGEKQGSQGNGSGKGSDSAKQGAQGGSTPASEEDGGSSPLVPILIAIAVLAAISIGVVVMRQRRRDSSTGSPVSPEAG